jgi:CheY-like chemotaxis protein
VPVRASDGVLDRCAELEADCLEVERTEFELGKVQHVVQEFQQAVGRVADDAAEQCCAVLRAFHSEDQGFPHMRSARRAVTVGTDCQKAGVVPARIGTGRYRIAMTAMTNVTRRPILIVDDDPLLADMLEAVLADAGYTVKLCLDSREAVQHVAELRPMALLLDIRMPEVDGWTVLRAVRRTPTGARLPVVLMSGAWRTGDQQRDIGGTPRLDPTIALPKPFELHDLHTALRRMGVHPR